MYNTLTAQNMDDDGARRLLHAVFLKAIADYVKITADGVVEGSDTEKECKNILKFVDDHTSSDYMVDKLKALSPEDCQKLLNDISCVTNAKKEQEAV